MSKYTEAERVAYRKGKAAAEGNTYAARQKKAAKKTRKYALAKEEIRKGRADAARARGPGVISSGAGLLGGLAGEFIGGPVGAGLGSLLGGKLGHLVEQITGFGDYRINSNSIMKGGMSPAQVVNSHNRGGYIVRHREFIGDILSTQAFAITTYALNPGIANAFPWLSQIANSFEEYRWRGLLFEFKTMSSNAVLSSSASTALGTVIMSTQYNSVAPPFVDKKTMENYEFACSSNPSQTFIHPVECKPAVTPVSKLYVRSGAVPANADQRLYDLGEFSIATQGMQNSGGVIGELWATYEIEFFKCAYAPQNQTDHFTLLNVTNAAPLGSTTTPNSGSSIGGTIVVSGTGYSFPPNISSGKYMLSYQAAGGSTALTAPTLGFTNCTPLNYWKNDTVSSIGAPTNGATSAQMIVVCTFIVTGQNASFGFSSQVLPTSVSSADLWITQISQSVVS